METLLVVIASLLILAGIVGCVLPVLPGPVLSFGGLLVLHLTGAYEVGTQRLVIDAILAGAVNIVDYFAPIYWTRRYGGSKYGTWGCAIGLVIGVFLFPPFGLILGPFAGAFIGELMAGNESNQAFYAAIGAFMGFVAGTLMKLGVALFITYHFIAVLVG